MFPIPLDKHVFIRRKSHLLATLVRFSNFGSMASSADEVVENRDLESKLTKTILNLEEIDVNLYR